MPEGSGILQAPIVRPTEGIMIVIVDKDPWKPLEKQGDTASRLYLILVRSIGMLPTASSGGPCKLSTHRLPTMYILRYASHTYYAKACTMMEDIKVSCQRLIVVVFSRISNI